MLIDPSTPTVLACSGIASDDDLAAVSTPAAQAVRVAFSTAHPASGCAMHDHDELEIVAVRADDPFLPPPVRAKVARLSPGHAIADRSHRILVGGTIAVPGVDIAIDEVADLGTSALLVTFDDALRLLLADGRPIRATTFPARTILISDAPAPAATGTWRVADDRERVLVSAGADGQVAGR